MIIFRNIHFDCIFKSLGILLPLIQLNFRIGACHHEQSVNKSKGGHFISRKHRVWFPGAVYHVINRGNYRQTIFRQPSDYQLFLQIVQDTMRKYPFILHSYCLMTNHFHLLLETKDVEIWFIMQRILKLYSINFNMKYHLQGHLFQGRYTAPIITDDTYFLQVSRYIHLNPVKSGIVTMPIDYTWSSYYTYITNQQNGIITIERERILEYFSNEDPKLYQHFVENLIPSLDLKY